MIFKSRRICHRWSEWWSMGRDLASSKVMSSPLIFIFCCSCPCLDDKARPTHYTCTHDCLGCKSGALQMLSYIHCIRWLGTLATDQERVASVYELPPELPPMCIFGTFVTIPYDIFTCAQKLTKWPAYWA